MLMKDIGYDPARDLQPVALAALSPLALVVQSTAPYSTIGEMTAASLSSPRGLSFASPGPGTPGHVAVEMLRTRTKSRLNHVPFEGGGPALDALMAGRVDMYFAVLPSAMPHVTDGKLKILGGLVGETLAGGTECTDGRPSRPASRASTSRTGLGCLLPAGHRPMSCSGSTGRSTKF